MPQTIGAFRTTSRPHTRPRHVLLGLLQAFLIVCGVGVLESTPAYAQFETPNRQFHNQTPFPLDGRHRSVACEQCHVRNVYRGTPNTCFDCHWVRRQDDRFRLQLGTQCERCHEPTTWSNTRWDHGAMTGMRLSGAHQQLSCQSCHQNDSFKTAQTECVSCHQRDYQAAREPNHVAAGFPTDCATCHKPSDTTFRQSTFNHNASFSLVGAHATATCASCHKASVYRGTPRDCIGCHREQYQRTTTPNHVAAGFPMTCESCHRPTDSSFRGTGFNHSAVFPLVGQHAQQTCATCHVNNVYKGTARDCVGCHRDDYQRTTAPNHVAAAFPMTCESCHRPTDSSFRGAGFNHSAVFPLVGQHAQQTCATCHVNNVYKGTARDCVGCHRDDYNRTTTPNHAASGFSLSCESCHKAGDSSFRGAGFNHSAVFPLVGDHAQVSCATCHVNNVYKGTPRECVGCHRTAYDRTTNPSHVAAGFPTTCVSCHKAADTSWTQGTFNHRFPIRSGPHRQTCATCHTTSGSYQVFNCLTCHEHDRSRMDDKHRNRSGYRYDSLACYGCHPNGKGD